MDEMNISEMLKAAEKANDLRKKETLRLIETGKAACEKIANVSNAGCFGRTIIRVVPTENGDDYDYRLVAEDGQIRIDEGYDFGYEHENIRESYAIAYASETYSKDRIPGPNEYGIPENYRLNLHDWRHSPNAETVSVAYYPDRGDGCAGSAVEVPGHDWFAKLPFHLEEPQSITRSLWIDVVSHLSDLADDMKQREEKKLSYTSSAADLAEKIVTALK
uniref:Uncharacterized protein n=1 Tax=viral metagenome TaxID=1070528 RepID=A0A6H1ZS72_9ZZZZ